MYYDRDVKLTEVYLDEECVRKKRPFFIDYRDLFTVADHCITDSLGQVHRVAEYADEIQRQKKEKESGDPDVKGDIPGAGKEDEAEDD